MKLFRLGMMAIAMTTACLKLAPASHGAEPVPPAKAGQAGDLSEDQKIQRLISSVESLKDAKFRRNGSDYGPKEAADHLRRKLKAAGDRVKTAEQFIDGLASKSSVSGEAYEIRYADGRVVKTADFLKAELKKLEQPAKEKKAE